MPKNTLRKKISLGFVMFAITLLVVHNLVPHHHAATIVPCNHNDHSCSHTSALYTQFSTDCDHSLCTLLFEFLSSDTTNISHAQPLLAIVTMTFHTTEVCEHAHQNLYTPRDIPLTSCDYFRDIPQRAPPVLA